MPGLTIGDTIPNLEAESTHGKIKLYDQFGEAKFSVPASTGRNMDEVVTVLESLQKANKHKVATSANWKSGDPMIISPLVSQDKAKKMFPQGYKTMDLASKKEYLRFTDV
ncbi:1-Cys peroxiredoxin PER1-like [Pyrus x bretschneideri]|uniref:1-Cys peroxiredoxin PER1-like n=1 Tax=Pyrus x bretschneideri TaxID=225117 RepID=UPI00202FE1F0|nr:1-Cys peroxiredoxin PER1-like [Pyrus x bretschneideri]